MRSNPGNPSPRPPSSNQYSIARCPFAPTSISTSENGSSGVSEPISLVKRPAIACSSGSTGKRRSRTSKASQVWCPTGTGELALYVKRVRCLSVPAAEKDATADIGMTVGKEIPDGERHKDRYDSGDDQNRAGCLTQLADLLRVSTPQANKVLPKTGRRQPRPARGSHAAWPPRRRPRSSA
jgi:hypothetical protein